MKNLIGILSFLVIASCSSDPVHLVEESFNHEKYKKYEFVIADDAKLIIRSNDIDEATIESIKEEYTMSHLGISSMNDGIIEKVEKGKKWEDALFLAVPKQRGAYYWENVDVDKVDYQTYSMHTRPKVDGSQITYTIYELIHHRVNRKTGIYNFDLYDYVDKGREVDGIRASLHGHSTDIYINTELLQSEIRCIDNPYCEGFIEDERNRVIID